MKKNQFGGEAMKEILNPHKKSNDKMWSKKNLEVLKIIEEKKKRNKEQKEIENELIHKNDQYKLDIFKNIPSKFKENTKNWINIEQSKHKPTKNKPLSKIRTKSQNKPLTGLKPTKPFKMVKNIYIKEDNEPKSMFDKYYANKIRSKSPSSNIRLYNNDNYNYEENENIQKDISNIKNINNENIQNGHGAEIENLIREYKEKYGEDEELENMIEEYSKNKGIPESKNDKKEQRDNIKNNKINQSSNINTNINNRKRDIHKAPTPTVKDAPIILPKIHRNYIRENRQLVIDNKIQNKNKIIEDKKDVKHQNYGKVPEYIKKYEMEREIKKEEIKKQEMVSKYPKGTKLLSEEERINTLNGLINSKKEMTNLLEKLPITTRTLSMQNKKEELIKKIEEVEKAIDVFSKKQVFIQA